MAILSPTPLLAIPMGGHPAAGRRRAIRSADSYPALPLALLDDIVRSRRQGGLVDAIT
jgi:hypothetical protein